MLNEKFGLFVNLNDQFNFVYHCDIDEQSFIAEIRFYWLQQPYHINLETVKCHSVRNDFHP